MTQNNDEEALLAVTRRRLTGRVCATCVPEEGLAAFVQDHGEVSECEWCGCEAMVVELEDLGAHIHTCLSDHYSDAAEYLPYETAEGGYQGATYDVDDLLQQEEVEIEDGDLYLALLHCVGDDRVWCDKDPALMPEHFTLRASWAGFEARIKSGRRFFASKETPEEIDTEPEHPDRLLTVEETLGEVCTRAHQVGLFTNLPAGIEFFRARTYANDPPPTGAEEFGPPPAQLAKASRMSAAGIPMLYAALEPLTAESEVPTESGERIALGSFVSTRPLLVLDLRKVRVPSVFDEQHGKYRESYLFLKTVAARISDPIVRDGREHVDYVPTQAFAEYLRFEFRPDGDRVDGVLFASSRQPNGSCVTLFATQADLLTEKGGYLQFVPR